MLSNPKPQQRKNRSKPAQQVAHASARYLVAVVLSLLLVGSISGPATAAPLPAPAATVTVNFNTDVIHNAAGQCALTGTGTCSLRDAIIFANSNPGTIISIPVGTFTLSITGSDNAAMMGDLDINANVTINGAGSGTTIITTIYTSTCGDCKVFGINQDGTHDHLVVSFSGMTIQNGFNSFSASCQGTFQETGGGIDVFQTGDGGGGSFTMNDVIVMDNKTTNPGAVCVGHYGGGINIDAGGQSNPGVTHNTDSITLTNVQVLTNTADSTGGGINFFGDQNTMVMNNVTFSGNTTLGTGGLGASGGGINVRVTYGGSLAMHHVAVSNNTSKGVGGGIALTPPNKATFTMDDTGGSSSITGNTIQADANQLPLGGGLFKGDGLAGTVLTNVTISNNHTDTQGSGGQSPQGGGVFFNSGGTMSMTGGSITNNTANDVVNNKGDGGGIATFASSGSATLTNVTISGNTARVNGGGVWVDLQNASTFNLNLDGVTTSGNAAPNGSGVFIKDTKITCLNTVSIGENLNIAGGTFVSTSGTLNLGGDFKRDMAGTFNHNSGTVVWNGGGAQNINGTATSETFNVFTVNKSGGTLAAGGSTTTLAMLGNVTLTAGTFDAGTATAINVGGNWTNNGATFTPSSSTVTFNSTVAGQAINGSAGTQTFNGITVNKTGQTLSVGGSTTTLTLNGTLTLSAGTFAAGTATTINVGGNWTNNAGTAAFTPGSGVVVFNGSVAQAINGSTATQTFNNVTVNKSNILSVSGSTTSLNLNTMTLTAGTLNAGTATAIGVSGDWTNNGGSFTPASSTVTFNNTGAAQSINGSAASQTFNSVTVNKTGQTLSVGGSTTTLTLNGSLTITAGTFAAGTASAINVAGNWSNSGTFTPGAGTVTLNGNGNTQTLSGSTTFNNLTVNHSGAGSVTASGSTLGVTGLLHVQAGTFTSSSTFGDVQIDSGATLAGSNATTMSVGGNWTNNGTFSANGNAVVFNGGAAQTIGGTSSTTFNDLTINNSGPGVTLGNNQTANGLLTLSTDLTTTNSFTLTLGANPATAGSGDVWGNTARNGTFVAGTTYSFGNPNVSVKFASGTPPTFLRFNLGRSVPPASGFANAVQRLYDIKPVGGSGFQATLRLHYLDTELNGNTEGSLALWRYIGGWVQFAAAAFDTTQNWAETAPTVNALSPWVLASSGPQAPTAVTISEFDARALVADQSREIAAIGLLGVLVLAGSAAWGLRRRSRSA